MEFDNEKIRVVNAPELDEFDKAKAMDYISSSFAKVSRLMQSDFTFTVHFKEYEKEGSRKKFAVKTRVAAIGHSIQSEHTDWDALKALHSALSTLESEVRGKLSRHREKNPHEEQ